VAWTDLSDRVLRAGVSTFGRAVIYTPQNLLPVSIAGVFDAAFERVSLDGGVAVADVQPALGVRLADLPVMPATGDVFSVAGVPYTVSEVQIDGQGGARLMAHRSD